jgi:hypothetical protein
MLATDGLKYVLASFRLTILAWYRGRNKIAIFRDT